MADNTKLGADDAVHVTTNGSPRSQAAIDAQARREIMKQQLADRKAHLAEVEKRVKRKDYSPEKLAQYRAALARASAEVKALDKEMSDGND